MLKYDNLEDVKSKLVGTFCYYDNKACIVKSASVSPQEKDNFVIGFTHIGTRSVLFCNLDDPLFNFMKFNIGYSNTNNGAVWWFRVPHKQYYQGLKNNQMNCVTSNPAYEYGVEFNWSGHVVNMMEGKYPTFEETEKLLKDGNKVTHAFHKNVACTWDSIHKDLILEYKGKKVGCMLNKKDITMLDEYKHLQEAIKEALG